METPVKKKHKGIRILLIVVGVLVLLIGGLILYVMLKPQTVINMMQSAMYEDPSQINSFDPHSEPGEYLKENGVLYVNDLQYADTYPNSYLDISYPDGYEQSQKPTIVYFHGGGFFGGDKFMGDPLAESDDSNYLFDRLIAEGFNFVNVNYVLMPDGHFPDPIIPLRCMRDQNPMYADRPWYADGSGDWIYDTKFHYGEWNEPLPPGPEVMELFAKGGTAADFVTHMACYGKPEVATAYTKRSCETLSRIAHILGREEEPGHMGNMPVRSGRLMTNILLMTTE